LNHVAEQYKSSGDIVPIVGDITSKDGIAKIVEQIGKASPNGINVLYVSSFWLSPFCINAEDKLTIDSTMLVSPEKGLGRDMRRAMMSRNLVSSY